MKKLSLASRSPGPIPFDELLAGAKALGFAGIELDARTSHPPPDGCDTPAHRADLRRQVADAGLELSGMAGDTGGRHPFQDGSSEYLAEVEKTLEFAADLGIRMIRLEIDIPPSPDDAEDRARFARAATALKSCARRASDEGIRILGRFGLRPFPCVQDVPPTHFDMPGMILDLVERVDEPNFGVAYHSGQAHEMFHERPASVRLPRPLPGGATELLTRLGAVTGAITFAPSGPELSGFLPALLEADLPAAWWCLDAEGRGWEAVGVWKETLTGLLDESERS